MPLTSRHIHSQHAFSLSERGRRCRCLVASPLFCLSFILAKIGEKPRNRLLALLLSSVLVLGWKSIAERLSGYDIHTMDTSTCRNKSTRNLTRRNITVMCFNLHSYVIFSKQGMGILGRKQWHAKNKNSNGYFYDMKQITCSSQVSCYCPLMQLPYSS